MLVSTEVRPVHFLFVVSHYTPFRSLILRIFIDFLLNRLDFEGQLLEDVQHDNKSATASYGIRLPVNFTPTSLSILVQPTATASTQSASCGDIVGRAVLLLSSPEKGCSSNRVRRSNGIRYMSFQCQLVAHGNDGVNSDKEHWRVLAGLGSSGSISLEHWSSGDETYSSVFLAGASFQFDLRKGKCGKHCAGNRSGYISSNARQTIKYEFSMTCCVFSVF